MNRRSPSLLLIITLVIIIALSACQADTETTPKGPSESPAQEQAPASDGTPSNNSPQEQNDTKPPLDDDAIRVLWETSAHASAYVMGDDGKNSSCARCHAPAEYIPTLDEMPESCAACKFEVDPPPPMIAEANWSSVQCNICHRVKKGEVDPQYAWLAIPPIDDYEDLASTTELCVKCHVEVDVEGHMPVEIAGAHADYTCTQCHDAHATTATCSTADCHPDVMEPSASIPGHDEDHQIVECWACHDADGLEIGIDEQGMWTTVIGDLKEPFASHNTVTEALCERCHFAGNPWELSDVVSSETP